MGKHGLKIKTIKAGTLYGYNMQIRSSYDYKNTMFNNSLFHDFLKNNGLNSWKDESTRDIICIDFDFGSPSYQEEMDKLKLKSEDPKNKDRKELYLKVIEQVRQNKEKYKKKSADELRELFYKDVVNVEYITKDPKTQEIKKRQNIEYKMLYRNASKAKVGQVMFINRKLYRKAYDWMTMGLGDKMPETNAKIVELSAYAPLTTSTIIDKIHIPVEDILILKDQDSFFKTIAKVVKGEDYPVQVRELDEEETEKNKQRAFEKNQYNPDGSLKFKRKFKTVIQMQKKCVVHDEITQVKNTMWDGMGLIEKSIVPDYVNGMVLLRHHFFKNCNFVTNIQLFFQDWCRDNNINYDTFEIEDMFGVKHLAKNIKMITTDNAIKWKKFADLMGDTLQEAYLYWCERINMDGSLFGVVKTDHESKLGDVQQLSYQMINTLPSTKEDIKELARQSVEYVELIKSNDDEFEKFLRKNANEVNHYEMMADLYEHNNDFSNSKWFRREKSKIILSYVDRLRKGKIIVNGDNLTICGNPYALLMYSVNEDWTKDPTLNMEKGTIQCYTTRFNNGEFLCGIRNPQNSPNNICYLHNRHSDLMKKYFVFSPNILAVNCIQTDVQDRANGGDFDSDFFMTTNNPIMVKCAKDCYERFPTIVNALKESGITYNNTMSEYARMDNKFSKSKIGIGLSSNLAQLGMTYYWTKNNKELYDNFIILSVLAQVIIDGCKREYEVDGMKEIDRILKLDCMKMVKSVIENEKEMIVKCDLPKFMKYTKDIPITKNGNQRDYEDIKKDKIKLQGRINNDLICPMNWLKEVLDEIKSIEKSNTTPTEDFFIKMQGKPNNHQMTKIRKIVDEYDSLCKKKDFSNEDDIQDIIDKYDDTIKQVSNMKIGNILTINRLIESALSLNFSTGRPVDKSSSKYTRKMLNTLYKMNKTKFLINFVEKQ